MAFLGILLILLLAVLTDCHTLSHITAVIPGVHSPGSSIRLKANYTPTSGDERITVQWTHGNDKLAILSIAAASNISQDTSHDFNRSYLNVSYDGMIRIMTLTILNLSLNDNSSIANLSAGSVVTENIHENYILQVSECEIPHKPNKTKVTYSNYQNYNSVANYSCLKGRVYVDNVVKEPYSQTCSVSAQWQPPDFGECWFAPSSINVTQNTFYENETLNLSCSSTNDGYPLTTGFNFTFKDYTFLRTVENLIDTSHVLTSDDYNALYACRIISKYTEANPTNGVSENKRMTVYFGPKMVDYTRAIHIPLNQSRKVIVEIKANDRDKNLTVFISKNGENVSTKLNQKLTSYDDIYFNYSYIIRINSSDDYGDYVFNARTTNPSDNLALNIHVSSTEITTRPPLNTSPNLNPGISIGIIIGISAAGIAVIALIILLVILRRRRQNKYTDKEERLNPVYDVTNMPGTLPEKEDRVNPLYGGYNESADKSNVKEERINPIYGSANDGSSAQDKKTTPRSNHNIEEAYSTVEKGGNDNPIFNNDTYAEVKKVKPKEDKNATSSAECMYAEVKKDKPKAKDTSTGLHGSTNSTSAK